MEITASNSTKYQGYGMLTSPISNEAVTMSNYSQSGSKMTQPGLSSLAAAVEALGHGLTCDPGA